MAGVVEMIFYPERAKEINPKSRGGRPRVKQQVVEAGLDDALPPLSVLIRLVELLAQSLLVRLTFGQLEGPQGATQFRTVA